MTTSDKLFRLIKSLTKGEVKFFKTYASKTSWTGPNLYFTLFDKIRRQDEYNEKLLIKKLYPKDTSSNKFRVLKHQLFQLIVKSLRNQYETDSTAAEIATGLQTVSVFCRKMIYDNAITLLEKLKQKAVVHCPEFLTQIHYWEFRVAYGSRDLKLMSTLVETWETEKPIAEVQNRLFTSAITDFSKLFIDLKQKGMIHSPEEKTRFLERTNLNLEIQEEDTLLSKHLKMYMKGLLAYMLVDDQKVNPLFKALLKSIQEDYESPEEYPFFYATALSDTAVSSWKKGDYEELEYYLQQMKKRLKTLPKGERFRNYTNYFALLLSMQLEYGKFENSLLAIEEMKTIELEYHSNFPASFANLYAYTYFGLGNYELALDWIEASLKNMKKGGREDLDGVYRIMQIIILFELGESYIFLLESVIRSTYRSLKKRSWNFKFEQLFLRFAKSSIRYVNKQQLIEGFKSLKLELAEINKDPHEKEILIYFDFDAWLNSKINDIAFKDAIQKER